MNALDKVKLLMLYSLRYEDDPSIRSLKSLLRDNSISDTQIGYIDLLLNYAGKFKRTLDLFSNKDLLSKSKNIFTQVLKNVPNVYTQHISFLASIVQQFLKGKTNPNEIETINISTKEKFNKVIVFAYGGITYEEIRDMTAISKANDIPIIAGGTCIHNSKSFIAELVQLKNYSGETKVNIGI